MQEEQAKKQETAENFATRIMESQAKNQEYAEKFMNNTFKGMGIAKVITGIVFIIAFCIIAFVMFKIFTFQTSGFKNNITASDNAELSKYQFKVTGYEVVEDVLFKPKEGYELVKFFFTLENKTNKQLIREEVNCIVNEIAQTNTFSSGYSTLPMFISANLTVKGDATFEVPKDSTSYDIRYGDNVTIHMEK